MRKASVSLGRPRSCRCGARPSWPQPFTDAAAAIAEEPLILSKALRPGWPRSEGIAAAGAILLCALAAPLFTGCGDAKAKQEDARILAEFRGPQFIPASERRPNPAGPPYVPHVVYTESFQCLVCHKHEQFHFRGQLVPKCPHPERTACLQCHVPWQNKEAPFRFEMLGAGAPLTVQAKTH